MCYKTNGWLKSILFCLVLTVLAPVKAKDVYGFMTGNSSDGEIPIGMYKFDDATLKPELLTPMMYSFWAGAYAADKYLMILSDDASGYLTEGLCKYDLDSKTLTLRYAQQPYQCSDLTYDYATSTLYGVMVKSMGEDVKPRLIKIDTATGSYTRVADLGRKLCALAATYYGELYAMGDDGKLYELDKVTGELTLVGNTGVKAKTSEAQSMEFDRATGELYWSGLDENDNTFFNQLNPATGQVIQTAQLADNALIVGLHIPFRMAPDGAPAKPQHLAATVKDEGVTLTWTNPTCGYVTTETLTTLTKVEIWKNGQLLHTIDHPQPGATASYTDTAADTNGKVRYIVYAYNDKGRGEGAFVKVMTGEDSPSCVTGLTLAKTADGVKLSWTAPATGKHGGSLNPANLTYTVSRQPDGKTFADLKDTSLTDTTLTTARYYRWTVTCRNAAGESDGVQTEPFLAGQPLTVPFVADFASADGQACWRVVDHNADGYTWIPVADGYVYNTNYTQAADDSLVSVPFRLEKGRKYVVKYDIKAPDVYSSEHFRLSLKGVAGEQVLEDLNHFTTPGFTDAQTRRVAFTVAESGEGQFCLAALSEPGQFMIQISAFSLEEEHATDLKADSLTATSQLNKGRQTQLAVKVTNNGTQPVDRYTVRLLDSHDAELSACTVDEPLAAGSSSTVSIAYTPTVTGTCTVKAVVKAEGDTNESNDSVAALFYVLDKDDHLVEVGGKDYATDYPFWFSGYEYSYAQTIYFKEEIGSPKGYITEIHYDYANQGGSLADKHIKVYLSNTDHYSVSEGWIDQGDMTLAVDTVVTFLGGDHTLRLRLQAPFSYAGGNLCVMTQKIDSEKSDAVSFYAMDDEEVRTAVYNGNEPVVDLRKVQGATRVNQVGLVIRDNAAATVLSIPESGRLSLRFADDAACASVPARLVVTDLCGKRLVGPVITSRLSFAGLVSGVYIVTAEADGQHIVQKIIVR